MTEIARNRATDPSLSFLVQAPAGSGKTELLTRRILALLAVVDEPEEILALTFTRKAAAEMGNRVIGALGMEKPGNDETHRLETWKLARKALERSEERGWNLAGHPARLRIMTLDSLAGMLARQLPLLSGLGDVPVPGEHSAATCRKAAEQTLAEAMRNDSPAVEKLLLHQDHNSAEVIGLMARMLENRDQWLRHVAEYGRDTGQLRRIIEENLATYLNAQLRDLDAMVPIGFKPELVTLTRYAGLNLGNEEMQSFEQWPSCDLSGMARWKQLVSLLLTGNEARFRKSVDKRNGFPSDGKEQKAAFLSLLEELATVSGLAEALHGLRSLPDTTCFDEAQWMIAEALFELLPLAVHNLKSIHAGEGRSDFTEIAMRALEALNDAEGNPSDLLLRMDYRISHILIDEFQDTSELQINLLHRLTAGWQPDDGRTLFMVGDPMQSIYRFRKAEVGFFLLAAKNKAGLPPVESLKLERNFRSSPVIVDWVNLAFRTIFPRHEDAASGAIAHADAVPALKHGGTVTLHLQRESSELKSDDSFEAARVVELVRRCRNERPGSRIGILARTRKHLHAIIPALAKAEIPCRAINILPLQARPETGTMRALLRALLHPADDESWLALLRAPCCGLNTQALFELMYGEERCLSRILFDSAALAKLDADAKARVEFVAAALAPCVQMGGASSLRQLVSVAWQRLGMPALIDATAATNVETLLDLIDDLDETGRIDFALLDERIGMLFAAPDVSEAAAQVELLTMHGAKGLQWDMVILPGLGKPPKNSDSPLLAFTEAPLDGKGLFLMSPKAETRSRDPLFDLVQSIEKQKERHELARLLYVAATRAETELHLLGHISRDEKPAKGSFLEMLLQREDCFGADITDIEMEGAETELRRLPLNRIAVVPEPLAIPDRPINRLPEYGWAGPEAAPVGTALHTLLQRIGEAGLEAWERDREEPETFLRRRLLAEGMSGELLEVALTRCLKALEKMLASKMGRWILSGNHYDTHCEWEIWTESDGRLQQRFIDRSFIDDQNVRWIIDYKTGSHEGGNLNAFLDNEAKRYAEQLSGYRGLLHELEPDREIRTALYFPVFDGWREISIKRL